MTRFILFFLFQSFFLLVSAQNSDTIPERGETVVTELKQTKDSIPKNDSLVRQMDTSWQKVAEKFLPGNVFTRLKINNEFFGSLSNSVKIETDRKIFKGKEPIFYSIIALLLLFAFIKNAFPKYFNDLFRVAFRTTSKQRQIGEQLIQTPLPSLFMNIFFLISAGLYIDLLFQHYKLASQFPFWLLFIYIVLFLAVIYLVKYITLKLTGLLFNISPSTDTYIFIVFMINKIIGIILLPFLVLLAFTENEFYQMAIFLSYTAVFILLLYRFILSYGLVRNQIKLSPFHFFLYLCCFELAPLLLIYKLLLIWV